MIYLLEVNGHIVASRDSPLDFELPDCSFQILKATETPRKILGCAAKFTKSGGEFYWVKSPMDSAPDDFRVCNHAGTPHELIMTRLKVCGPDAGIEAGETDRWRGT